MKYNVDVWLDMDGVLADFDAGAQRQLGTDNTYKFEFVHGTQAFWDGLNENPYFFGDLPVMRDAPILLDALRGVKLGVLTALPHSKADSVREQKTDWVRENVEYYLNAEIPVVCCLTRDKPDYCTPGSVLIDDRAVNRDMWTLKGGRFIVHTDARSSIYQLKNFGVIA